MLWTLLLSLLCMSFEDILIVSGMFLGVIPMVCPLECLIVFDILFSLMNPTQYFSFSVLDVLFPHLYVWFCIFDRFDVCFCFSWSIRVYLGCSKTFRPCHAPLFPYRLCPFCCIRTWYDDAFSWFVISLFQYFLCPYLFSLLCQLDGHTLLSSSKDRTVVFWDIRMLRPDVILRGHRNSGEVLLSYLHCHLLVVWTLFVWSWLIPSSMSLLRWLFRFPVFFTVVLSIDTCMKKPYVFASGSGDRRARIWDFTLSCSPSS